MTGPSLQNQIPSTTQKKLNQPRKPKGQAEKKQRTRLLWRGSVHDKKRRRKLKGQAENKAAMERKKREASTQKGAKPRAASKKKPTKKKPKSKFRQDNKAPSAARHRADEAYFDNVHKDASIPLRPPNVHVSDNDDDSINIEGADMSMGMESGDEEMNQQYSTNRVNGEANKMRKVE